MLCFSSYFLHLPNVSSASVILDLTLASESDSTVDISTDSAYITSPCGETVSERPSFLSVFDVYDIAAAIGKEFETIIDKHGPDSVCSLMPKVIHILEELEDYASRLESQDGEILALQAAVDRIEFERLSHAQDRLRCEQEVLKLEQTWQAEAAEFKQIIHRLKDENMFLIRALDAAKVSDECPYGEVAETAGEEVRLMLRLKEVIDKQRIEIRALKRQLAQSSIDLDAIQQQANRLAKLNAVLRRKHGVSKRQAAQLAEDKSELETRLLAKEQLIQEMRDHVYRNSKNGSEQNALIDMATSTTFSLSASLISDSASSPTNEQVSQMSEEKLVRLLNTEGKMILDVPNSSRPRFTVDELRNALIERNELKSRIVEVEEELSVYNRAGDQDPPVQGPIDREPDEKLYFDQHRSSSGIQKFFKTLIDRLKN
uniref:RILP-like protein 1 n=3 Tax=Schistocephalus solidus TaxID=70667 RepID=A0A0V0JA69_SCHSO